jgi:branched-chain amino acid aminotransferase
MNTKRDTPASEGLAYIDGEYCSVADAKISVFDPGLTHSDAVYDVVSTWKGGFFRLDEHIARFQASCRGISIECPHSAEDMKRILATCVHRGGVANAAYVALVATRGHYANKEAERTRDIFNTRATFIAYALPYKWIADPEAQDRGAHLIISKTPRIPDECVDSRFKNYHWGDLTRGKFEARAVGADGAVHLSTAGNLTEGAGFNLFFAKGGRLFTPERNVLRGVTRQSALDLAAELGIPAEIGDYGAEALRRADEAFMTSTAGGIMPIVKIDDQLLGDGRPGPLSSQLRATYWRKREEGWLSTPVSSLLV